MKTFNDFLSTLDAEKLSNLAADAVAKQTDAFAGVSQASTAVTLELLR